MNHQIENNVDIQTPGSEDAQPVNFKEQGNPHNFTGLYDGRVESLQVPHL
jgi:hypothetical protein